jgi:hypothetical protein
MGYWRQTPCVGLDCGVVFENHLGRDWCPVCGSCVDLVLGNYPVLALENNSGFVLGSCLVPVRGSYSDSVLGSYPVLVLGSYSDFVLGSYPVLVLGSYFGYVLGSYPDLAIGSFVGNCLQTRDLCCCYPDCRFVAGT